MIIAVLAALSVSACSKPAPSWQRVAGVPAADLRAVADCGGRWWVAGGRRTADGGTSPAAWSSADGSAWGEVVFEPLPSSYYGPRQVITSIACDGDRVAMLGAVPGGAHGNPRVSTWRLEGGVLRENQAPFETYGGDRAVDVSRMAAGPSGFAIAGNRSSGAAAWLSSDGRVFTLVEGAPGLAGPTIARDAVALPGGRWALVGGVTVPNSADERAAAWVSADGRSWTRSDPPAATGFNEMQRAVRDGDDVLAAGARGTSFGLWRWHDGVWTAGKTFGGDPGGVRSLTVVGGKPVVAGGGLWIDGDAVATPGPPAAVAGRGEVLFLVTGDGLWRTDL
ncbi:hypothetical protein ACQP2F_02865 [Actinoplanes sp. CA-030573]|uniref:hypothetical protein n=1 Tax=Actinoplanes sp. CA-030573 TaxID=3239898 RepID=UPI003D8B010A